MISAGSCGDRPFKSQSGNLAVGGVDSGEIEISFKIGKVKALIELFLGSHPNYSPQLFRDSLGRKQGSSETDRYGKTTYRDAQGRIQGSKK